MGCGSQERQRTRRPDRGLVWMHSYGLKPMPARTGEKSDIASKVNIDGEKALAMAGQLDVAVGEMGDLTDISKTYVHSWRDMNELNAEDVNNATKISLRSEVPGLPHDQPDPYSVVDPRLVHSWRTAREDRTNVVRVYNWASDFSVYSMRMRRTIIGEIRLKKHGFVGYD